MSTASPTWLHENFEHTGSAFGLRMTRKLEEVQSPFQKIEMYESTDWGNVMLIDGAMMVTTRDNFFYHEMMAHAPLFTHAAPKDVGQEPGQALPGRPQEVAAETLLPVPRPVAPSSAVGWPAWIRPPALARARPRAAVRFRPAASAPAR